MNLWVINLDYLSFINLSCIAITYEEDKGEQEEVGDDGAGVVDAHNIDWNV